MRLVPEGFSDLYLNDYNHIVSSFKDPYARSQGSSSVQSVERFQAYPALGSKQLQGKSIIIEVFVKKDRIHWREVLASSLDTGLLTAEHLYAMDLNTGRLWYVTATPVSFVPNDPNGHKYTVTFEVDDPIWRSGDEVSVSANLVASGSSLTCRVLGNQNTEPKIEITLTTQKTGIYLYRQFVTFLNRSTKPLDDYPVDITNGGWDTDTLVGTKILASGNDLRVFVNGIEANRWIDSLDSATTKVWINVTSPPVKSFKLKVAIAGAGGITTLTVIPKITTSTGPKYVLEGMPQSGILRADTEEFTYTSYVLTTGVFSGVTRTQRGTSIDSHLANETVYFVPLDIQVMYGDADADTTNVPVIDDTHKPVLNLNTSTNTSWVYLTFGSEDPRSARFTPMADTSTHPDTRIYTATHEADVDPYTAMGMIIFSYQAVGKWQSVTGNQWWQLYHPCGITDVYATGEGRRLTVSWPAGSLDYSLKGVSWIQKWAITAPVAPYANWRAWTKTTHPGEADLGGTYPYIRFQQNGSVLGSAGNYADFEVLTCTITLSATLTPLTGLRGEDNTPYYSQFELFNVTTGESLFCSFPLTVGDKVIVDTEAHQAYRDSDHMTVISGVSWSSNRLMWLKLVSDIVVGYKDNVIQIIETGMGNITVAIKWRDRNN